MDKDVALHLVRLQKHQLLEARVQNEMKSPILAVVYCLIFGWMGAHRRYLGDKKGAAIILLMLAFIFIAPAIFSYLSYDPPAPRIPGSGIGLGQIGAHTSATIEAQSTFLYGIGMCLIAFQVFVWFDLLSIPYLMKNHVKDLRNEKIAEMSSKKAS